MTANTRKIPGSDFRYRRVGSTFYISTSTGEPVGQAEYVETRFPGETNHYRVGTQRIWGLGNVAKHLAAAKG